MDNIDLIIWLESLPCGAEINVDGWFFIKSQANVYSPDEWSGGWLPKHTKCSSRELTEKVKPGTVICWEDKEGLLEKLYAKADVLRTPTLHVLKSDFRFWEQVAKGTKTCEVRKDDRGYQVGDKIQFTTVDGLKTHKGIWEITHILTHEAFPLGLKPGYVALSIKRGGEQECG